MAFSQVLDTELRSPRLCPVWTGLHQLICLPTLLSLSLVNVLRYLFKKKIELRK